MKKNRLSKIIKNKLPLSLYIIEPEKTNNQIMLNDEINISEKYNTKYYEKEYFYKTISKII